VDKELLFKPRLEEDDVDLPGVGTVRVRAMNRDEAMTTQKIEDIKQRDLHIIAIGMVDPRLSVSEVRRWAEASPAGELESVSRRIAQLSGMLAGAAKEAYREMEADPDAEFRDVPGREAADDGGPAAGGTE
jgi:hypothetical protein